MSICLKTCTLPGDNLQTIVWIGTPARQYWVDMESGSNQLWLLDSQYPNLNRYQPGYAAV